MPNFILNSNPQSNGDHEVHNITTGCSHMPARSNQIDLGWHSDCHSAMSDAKRRHSSWKINGCYYCATSCHTA